MDVYPKPNRPTRTPRRAGRTDHRAVMNELAQRDPEAHARIMGVIERLIADKASRAAGEGPVPIACGWRDCDTVLAGHDEWISHQVAHQAEE